MKTKNVLLFACLFLIIANVSFAQTATRFGIRAGVNFQNINGDDLEGDNLDNKLKTGFHIGVDADIPIATDYYIRPGVLFSTKGAKADDADDTKINLSYIEVPINFVYKPVLGTGRLILGIGPYVAFAVGGKVKNGVDRDIEFENEVTLGQYMTNPYTLKRFDAGGNLLFGYEFSNRLFAHLNAQLGLVNINPDITDYDDDETKMKNTGFGLSIGYRF